MDSPAPTPAPAPATSKSVVFGRRLISFTILWTIVLVAMFSGNKFLSEGVFVVLMTAFSACGAAEFYDMVRKRGMACFKSWGLIGAVSLTIGTYLHLTGHLGIYDTPARVNDFETSFLILFVLGLCLCQFFSRTNPDGMQAISTTLFGLMYVPWLLNFIQKINYFPGLNGQGQYYLLYFILITKFTDTGAYVVGSLIGKHKMIPRISPAKTWEGFAGAIVVAVLASLVFTHFLGDKMAGMKWTHAIILGVILSLGAVVGDLIESLFKREAGVKDSGKYFPGIGGILDLLDSLLFNAPIMYLYLRHVLTHP